MTRHDIAPFLFVSLLALGACGGEVGPDAAVGDPAPGAEAPEAQAPVAPTPSDGVTLRFDDEALLERIRVSDGEARVIARRQVPAGRLVSAVLAEEDGRLVYAYELTAEDAPALVRVVVDAVSGRVTVGGREGAEG